MKVAIHLLNRIRCGGAENVAYNYAQVLRYFAVESIFIALPESKNYAKMLLENNFQIKSRITKKCLLSSDYIFVHSNQNLLKLLPYIGLLKRFRKKVIYIQHLYYDEKKFQLVSLLINLLCTDFIRITPITATLVRKYIKIRTHFIVNYHLNKYDEDEWIDVRMKVRKELYIPEKNCVYMFSGVFKPGKNVGEFICIASEFIEDDNATFLLVGDGEEATIVQTYAGKNIHWVGFVSDVEKYLIASDVYIFLSKKEMMPMALLEAVNVGKKIIAYKTEVNDFILDGMTYSVIDKNVLLSVDDTGVSHGKYDKEYAVRKLSELLLT